MQTSTHCQFRLPSEEARQSANAESINGVVSIGCPAAVCMDQGSLLAHITFSGIVKLSERWTEGKRFF